MGDQTGCDQLKSGHDTPSVMPKPSEMPKLNMAAHQRAVSSLGAVPRPSGGCSSGHWISDNIGDGKYIKLEDGSLWQVDATDTINSALWLETDDIIVCNQKLVNTDDKESAEARRIK
jgi:hypothetical protein